MALYRQVVNFADFNERLGWQGRWRGQSDARTTALREMFGFDMAENQPENQYASWRTPNGLRLSLTGTSVKYDTVTDSVGRGEAVRKVPVEIDAFVRRNTDLPVQKASVAVTCSGDFGRHRTTAYKLVAGKWVEGE